MFTLDSSTGDVAVFNVLYNLLESKSVIYPELRSIVVMSGNIKLFNDSDCFGIVLCNTDKKLRNSDIVTKVNTFILVDKSGMKDIGTSIDMILSKYGVDWEVNYGYETLVGLIEELDGNGNLDTWQPIIVESTKIKPDIYGNVSDNDLDSFLSGMEADAYEECTETDCPYVDNCDGEECHRCVQCKKYCTCTKEELEDCDRHEYDDDTCPHCDESYEDCTCVDKEEDEEDDDICNECGLDYDDCTCDQ